jgi:hypothetical protein
MLGPVPVIRTAGYRDGRPGQAQPWARSAHRVPVASKATRNDTATTGINRRDPWSLTV